jgi:hypothetical protein
MMKYATPKPVEPVDIPKVPTVPEPPKTDTTDGDAVEGGQRIDAIEERVFILERLVRQIIEWLKSFGSK